MCGVSTNILCTVSLRVDLPPKSHPTSGRSRSHGMPQPASSSMSRRYPASIIDSFSNTAVCVWSVEVRVIGIASTVMDSKPPSPRSSESQTWFGMLVDGEGRMRGLIWRRVPALTSSRVATSVPTTLAW